MERSGGAVKGNIREGGEMNSVLWLGKRNAGDHSKT
jgi:hypothetical protein